MEHMDTTYKNLTGVDIEQQKRLWDERGKGYYGEYLVLSELYPHIPGTCKILMNIKIPNGEGKTTEIDLLLIHETGFYVFEVKHYKGTIYGNSADKNWTQYFRTTSNEHFYNPVAQNQNHINALAKMFPGVPSYSFVVFTHPDCVLKITNIPEGISVCNLRDVLNDITPHLERKPSVFSMKDIDELFEILKKYSPMLEKSVSVVGEVVPFSDYVQMLGKHCQQFIAEKEIEFRQKTHKVKARITGVAAGVIIACLLFSVIFIIGAHKKTEDAIAEAELRISAAENALEQFAQKFEHVTEFNNGNISITDSLISVSDVVLEKSSDILNAINFACQLTCKSNTYGISIEEDAALVVILKDGTAKEYDLWNESYPYKSRVRMGGSSETKIIGQHEFYDIELSDIAYIKLTNLGVWAIKQYSDDDIATGYEIELYDAAETGN